MAYHFNNNRYIKFVGTPEDKKKYPNLNLLKEGKLYKIHRWWPESGCFTLHEFPQMTHELLEPEIEVFMFPIVEGMWQFDK